MCTNHFIVLETSSEEIFREVVFLGAVVCTCGPITPLVAVSGNGYLSTYCGDHSHHPSDTAPFTKDSECRRNRGGCNTSRSPRASLW